MEGVTLGAFTCQRNRPPYMRRAPRRTHTNLGAACTSAALVAANVVRVEYPCGHWRTTPHGRLVTHAPVAALGSGHHRCDGHDARGDASASRWGRPAGSAGALDAADLSVRVPRRAGAWTPGDARERGDVVRGRPGDGRAGRH